MRRISQAILAITIIILTSNVAIILAQAQLDPTGDCLNLAGAPTSCERYADITNSKVSMSNGSYNGTITLAGNVPSTTNSSSTFIEWDIAIDADRNPSTREWCFMNCGTTFDNLAVNGIGVDYIVRFWLQGQSSGAQIFDGPTSSWNDIQSYQVSGNVIQLYWFPSDIGGSKFFDYVILVRVYKNGGASDSDLLFLDKTPNAGHYEFQASNQTSMTTTLTGIPGQIGLGDFVLPIVKRSGLTGKYLTLSDFLGKVIALEFMAPWCPHCQRLAPFMESLYSQFAPEGAVFIGVAEPWGPGSTVNNRPAPNVTIEQFLSNNTSSLTYVLDTPPYRVENIYNVNDVPTLFVISKTGAIAPVDGHMDGVDSIERDASTVIAAMLAQVVVTLSSQTSTLSSTRTSQSSQLLANATGQIPTHNPIAGFPTDSIVLGLLVGFVLLIARRTSFKRKLASPRN